MFLAIVVLTLQLGSEDAFSKLVREISKVASEHSTAINASKSDTGKAEITRKNNERLQELATKAMELPITFEYQIQSLEQNGDGDYTVVLEPKKPIAKTELVNRRSLTIPIKKELGESLFTGDLLAFSGKLKAGGETRSKNAIPFAVVRPDGLKLLAIWIDEIEIGESKPKVKEDKEPVSEVVTPKMFITEIDRLFKEARTEVARGKTTADKQDSADKHAAIILDAVKNYDGKIFEFESTINDVVRGENKDELKAVVSHSEPIKWFSRGYAPLQATGVINLPIADEDRNEFVIGRKLIIRAKISVLGGEEDLNGRMKGNFALVRVNSQFVANKVVYIAGRELILSLQDFSTEFLPDKLETKRNKK